MLQLEELFEYYSRPVSCSSYAHIVSYVFRIGKPNRWHRGKEIFWFIFEMANKKFTKETKEDVIRSPSFFAKIKAIYFFVIQGGSVEAAVSYFIMRRSKALLRFPSGSGNCIFLVDILPFLWKENFINKSLRFCFSWWSREASNRLYLFIYPSTLAVIIIMTIYFFFLISCQGSLRLVTVKLVAINVTQPEKERKCASYAPTDC